MGFERCHPAVNLIYFAAVIAGTLAFDHPVFLLVSWGCAFVYSTKRNGWKALVFNLCLIPAVVLYGVHYSGYNHFGVTNLGENFIGNQMTLESLVYGLVIGACVTGVVMWMSCVYAVFSSDKVVYLFGRVSPRLSLFLAILLRLVPRIKKEAKRIHTAQKGIGRGINRGNIFRRIGNGLRILSMLITWTIESITTASESMRSRGSTLRGRTAFSIYRFDNRDRAYVVTLFACLTVVLMGVLLDQTRMQYNPMIRMNPVTPMSWFFFGGYAALCLMPLMLEVYTQFRFYRARKRIPQGQSPAGR